MHRAYGADGCARRGAGTALLAGFVAIGHQADQALVDSMALAFTQHLGWLTTADNLRVYEAKKEQEWLWKTNTYEQPRVADVEWIQLAAEMSDRFHRQFLRTVRALKDYRRSGPAVALQTNQQVNISLT